MINSSYYLKLLALRREWLFEEMKRLILDKKASISTIHQHEAEMVYIDEQKKELETK